MANGATNESFDDADQLDAFMKDSKAFDKLRKSTIADSRSVVDQFNSDGGDSAWPFLDRATVADRLLELIGPESSDNDGETDQAGRLIQQGAMNLCGPAAFFQFVIKRDPVMFANYATKLFNTGEGDLGQLHVAPGDDIKSANYIDLLPRMNGSICPQADWMVMGALRNSTNAFFTGSFQGTPEESIAAGTRPGELAEWLEKTGLYSSVKNEANWLEEKGIPHATGLSNAEGNDVAALINADLIRAARNLPSGSSWPMTEFPNHWVIVLGDTSQDVTKDGIFFNIWTWGETKVLEVPSGAFLKNYYGAIRCNLAR